MSFVRAARTQDVPAGKIYEFQVGGQAVAIANVAGKFCAINSICAHEGGPLGEGELAGDVVVCPWHGAKFNVKTGDVLGPPARKGVQCFPVKVQGNDVLVELE